MLTVVFSFLSEGAGPRPLGVEHCVVSLVGVCLVRGASVCCGLVTTQMTSMSCTASFLARVLRALKLGLLLHRITIEAFV